MLVDLTSRRGRRCTDRTRADCVAARGGGVFFAVVYLQYSDCQVGRWVGEWLGKWVGESSAPVIFYYSLLLLFFLLMVPGENACFFFFSFSFFVFCFITHLLRFHFDFPSVFGFIFNKARFLLRAEDGRFVVPTEPMLPGYITPLVVFGPAQLSASSYHQLLGQRLFDRYVTRRGSLRPVGGETRDTQ